MQVPFEMIGTVYTVLEQHKAQRLSEDYDNGTEVRIRVQLELERAALLQEAVRNATSGRVLPRVVDR
jgi:translation elongation factor EF-G